MTGASMLLAATLCVPAAMLLACVARPVRQRMLGLLWLAPLPAVAAALLAVGGGPLVVFPAALRLTFEMDVPGAILVGAASLLWTAAGAYAGNYLRNTGNGPRFAVCWLMAFTGCVGVFIAADMISFYFLLALMTLGACGLVIQDETADAWRAGGLYLGLALAAEALLLGGMILLAVVTPGDSLLIRDGVAALATSPWRDLTLALLIGGLGIKAGMVPLHFWIPLAHAAAPIPASAVLSGAVVKAGIIGLLRFVPFDVAIPVWGFALAAMGLVGAFYAVAVGITQTHPKAVLAYSSVSQMGVIVAVIGMGWAAADQGTAVAAAFYAAHHVLVKGACFLAVGVIMVTGARGRWLVVVPAVLMALSLGGLPLTGGALAKYAVKGAFGDGFAALAATLSGAGTTLLMLHFVRCLRAVPAPDSGATAPSGLAWPWLAMALSAVVVPWALFVGLPVGTLGAAFAPEAVWSALWPVLAGAAMAVLLTRWGDALPRIPLGDVVAPLGSVARAAKASGASFTQVDGVLREWPVAGVCLLAIAVALGTALL